MFFALAQTFRIQLVLCVGSYSQWVLGKTQLFLAAFKHAMFVCSAFWWQVGEGGRHGGRSERHILRARLIENVEFAAHRLLRISVIRSCSEAFWIGRAQITFFGSPITRIPLREHLFRARPLDKCKNICLYIYSLHALKHSGVAGQRLHDAGVR